MENEREKNLIEQAPPSATDPIPPKKREKKEKSSMREIIEAVFIALLLTVVIRSCIIDVFRIPSPSMVPTIQVEDRVAVTRFTYWLSEPERGDIIVFKYPLDTKVDYIKRLIGLPGETIAFKDNKLYVNDLEVAEPYLPEGVVTADFGPVRVPEDSYFMCGDNREHSSDGRTWGFVSKDLLIGKSQFIYWPFERMGGL